MPEPRPVILILDDEPMVTTTIKNYLDLQDGYETIAFNRPAAALDYLAAHPVDLIISDQIMPETSGLEFFARAKQIQPEAVRVLLTGYAQKEDAIRAINETGLFQFVEKPWSNEQLHLVVRNGLERKRLYTDLHEKIGALEVAGEDIVRLRNALVELYLEKGARRGEAAAVAAEARGELQKIVGSAVRSGARRFLYAFAMTAALLLASVSFIVYRSFFAFRQEAAGLKVQIGDIQSKQLNAAEVERFRSAAVARTAQPTAGESIIAKYQDSVCLITGAYNLRDRSSGRLLRLQAGSGSTPEVDPEGNVALTLEGDGPPLEHFHTGTGFLAAADGKIVTNRHVAQPWWADEQTQKILKAGFVPQYRVFVAYFPRRRQPVALKILKTSEKADVAVLSAPPGAELPEPIPLAQAAQKSAPGASVLLLHYPLGLEALVAKASPKELERIQNFANLTQEQVARELARLNLILPFATQGHISNVTDETLVYDAITTVGGSGGPLFNLDGKVIAVNFAVLTQFAGVSLGIPIRHAIELMGDKP